MPVRMPSPVVDSERKMMWPDCSPPRLSPSASRAASTWRSPTSVSRTPMPRPSIARRKPRLVMTVTATVLPARRPRSARSSAKRARSTSPSTMVPVWSTAMTRSASPSNASPRSAWCSTTARDSCVGSVDPHRSLMFAPSGLSCSAVTRAPRSASTHGAISLAAPLAQSMTMRRPSRRRPSVVATRCCA